MMAQTPPALIGPLLNQLSGRFFSTELGLVRNAYEVAARWHDGQLRKSGDPYITHPVAVATLAADAGQGCAMVCAALLHDVLTDTDCDPALLRAQFGDEVTSLVEGLAAYGRTGSEPGDDRIVILKLLDRLHNMRTIQYVDESKQVLRSRQTLDLFVPRAQRLGLDLVAGELQELALDRLRALAGAVDETEMSWRALWFGACLLPPVARERYREEWSAELRILADRRGRRRFARQLLLGLPRLSVTLRISIWRDQQLAAGLQVAADCLSRAGLESLRWLLRSQLRPWSLLAPAVAWIALRTARSNLGDAMATLITVPPVLNAGIQWLRARLCLSQPHRKVPH
ncbi:MAG: HD domain-containing protein [Micromonosporaceae bacterium]